MFLKKKSVRLLSSAVLAVIIGSAGMTLRAADDKEKLLTRTLYAPVYFTVCPQIDRKSVKMWVVGQEELPFSPAPRTFMFTYYPEHEKKFLPPDIELRIEADAACEEAAFEQAVIITPTGVWTSTGSTRFATEKLMKQVRNGSRDLRAPTSVVRIGCSASCGHPNP